MTALSARGSPVRQAGIKNRVNEKRGKEVCEPVFSGRVGGVGYAPLGSRSASKSKVSRWFSSRPKDRGVKNEVGHFQPKASGICLYSEQI